MQKIKGKQQWTQEEKTMMAELFPKYPSKKWKMISIQMAKKGFKRTELECRQKWINFLDPNLNNQEWEPSQLQKLYSLHDKYGTRWCYMQKELNRTQNKIKNRFYGTIRNYVRLILNTLCQRNNCFNAQINKISPSLLNDLYNSENIFDFLRGQVRKMIFRMKFKIDKKVLKNRIREKQHLYKELIGLLASLFKGSFSLRILDKIQDQVQSEERQVGDQIQEDKNEKLLLSQDNINIKQQEIQNLSKKEQTQHKNVSNKDFESSIKQNQKCRVQRQSLRSQQSGVALDNMIPPSNNSHTDMKNTALANPFFQNYPFYPQFNHNPAYYHPFNIDHNMQMSATDRMRQNQMEFGSAIERIRYQSILMMMMQQREIMSRQFANQDNQHMK